MIKNIVFDMGNVLTAAYLDFFQTFSLKPEECFFIDDTPANIEAAGNLGMDGCVYYGDIEELRMNLKNKIGPSFW